MAHCESVVVLADSDKFDTIAANKIADLDQIDLLITNAAPGDELSAALNAADVTVATTKEEINGVS